MSKKLECEGMSKKINLNSLKQVKSTKAVKYCFLFNTNIFFSFLFLKQQVKRTNRIQVVNSPDNCGIIDNLKRGKRQILQNTSWRYENLTVIFTKSTSHQDESQYREDVVGGISEKGPPCQNDGLRREVLNVRVPSLRNNCM